MSPRGIIIVGANGNCQDIAETVEALAGRGESLRVLGFLDDADSLKGTMVAGYPVLGRIDDAARFGEACFVNGIGSPSSYRRKPDIAARIGVVPERWATIIHPTAAVSRQARIGYGTVVLSQVSIGAGATLGNHCLVLQNSVISHGAEVGDFTAVATGVCVSGGCRIGENCYLGANSSIRDGICIASGVLVGIGSVVVKDFKAPCVAYGNPARERS